MHIGVDTDKKWRVLVALDPRGRPCGTRSVANTLAGWAAALRWVHDLGPVCIWGIKNTGVRGKGFAQFRLTSGETAVHTIVPRRTAQYRTCVPATNTPLLGLCGVGVIAAARLINKLGCPLRIIPRIGKAR